MEAELRTEAHPDQEFKAKVVRVAPVLSADSRQARVELEVANPGHLLKPGMYAEVIFVFGRRDGVWSVEDDVPFRRHDGYVIFVADQASGKVSQVPVELGLREGNRVELRGLGSVSGPVVTLGQHLLQDGQPFKVPGHSELPAKASGPGSASS
jgi:multidrug efflux pump subunit AcrA (membrane-fusion protein)